MSILYFVSLNRQPAWIRFGTTTLLSAAAGALRLALDDYLTGYSFFLFIPAVFLAALLFDQWVGYWTTALSLFLGSWMKFGEGSFPIASKEELIPVALFALTCFGIISITQALRGALIRLRNAEAEKSLLYDELAHRTQNNLQVVTSLLTLQARSYANPELRSALQNAIARIEVIAGAHRRLQQRHGASVDMEEYLGEICGGLRRLFDDILPIELRVGKLLAGAPITQNSGLLRGLP